MVIRLPRTNLWSVPADSQDPHFLQLTPSNLRCVLSHDHTPNVYNIAEDWSLDYPSHYLSSVLYHVPRHYPAVHHPYA
jgi:hypothetical protein